MDDAEIRSLLSRLARPHPSGGHVIERAAILAEGAEFPAILAWISAHAGQPEALVARPSSGGLHSTERNKSGGEAEDRSPQRYVLPPATLS